MRGPHPSHKGSAGTKTTFIVRDLETDEEIHRVETEYTGSQLDKVEDGLYLNLNLDRFWVEIIEGGKA